LIPWIYFHAGLNSGESPWYLFWSGVFPALEGLAALSVIGGIVAWYRRGNCKKRWCPRIGHFPFTDPADGVSRLLCWKHHPDVKHKHLHQALIDEIQERRERHHIYLGDKPGRG
jgi:hypothetical protein